MADFRRFAELGMIPSLAKRLAAQIEAGTVDLRVLTELGMVPAVARAIKAQVAAGTGNARQLTALGVDAKLADEIVAAVGGGVVPPDPGSMYLSANAIPYGAAEGTVIGTVAGYPAGWELVSIYDENGLFALSGANLVTTAAKAIPATYRVCILARSRAEKKYRYITPDIVVQKSQYLDLTGAVAGWSTRRLRGDFAGTPAAIDAGVVVSLADQIGSKNATSRGAPAVGPGTINGHNWIAMDGTDDGFTHSEISFLGDFGILSSVGSDIDRTSQTLVGRASNASPYFRIRGSSGTTMSFRPGGTAYSLNIPQNLWSGLNVAYLERVGSTMSAYGTDGLLVGSVDVGTAAVTVDCFGFNSGGNWLKGSLNEVVYFEIPGGMPAEQRTFNIINTAAAFKNRQFVDPDAGVDTNGGWVEELPVKTLTRFRDHPKFRGAEFYLKRGGVFRERLAAVQISMPQRGDLTARNRLGAYGTGAKPIINGAERLDGTGWELVTGTEYRKIYATGGSMHFVETGQTPIPLTIGTAGSLAVGQRATLDGYLHINVGKDPSVGSVEVGKFGTVSTTLDYWRVDDIESQFSGGSEAINPSGISLYVGVDVKYSGDDAFNFQGGAKTLMDCTFFIAGLSEQQSSAGQGFTNHGSTRVNLIRCGGSRAWSYGMGGQGSTRNTIIDAFLSDCREGVMRFSDNGTGPGENHIYGGVFERNPGNINEMINCLNPIASTVDFWGDITLRDLENSASSIGIFAPNSSFMLGNVSGANISYLGVGTPISWNRSANLVK